MHIDGYNLDELPDQFEIPVGGVLTLDADGLLYAACHKVARLETAIRRAKTRIFELQFLTKCSLVRAHLTSRDCFKSGRHLVLSVKPYQGNRTGKPKPPLLEPLREQLARPGVFQEHEGIEVYLHREREADDAMMMDAYTIPGVIGYSPDKDLQIMPCGLYDLKTGRVDIIKDRYGWIKEARTEAGSLKIVGHGTAFFWAQMVMGDPADNVKGLLKLRNSLVGPGEALWLLGQVRTEDDAANAVLDCYRAINQNPLPEAVCLWLLRSRDDTAEGYIWSLNLSARNREFVKDCYNRVYRKAPEEVSNEPNES